MLYQDSKQLAAIILSSFKSRNVFSFATKAKVLKDALQIIKNANEEEKEEIIKSLNKE